MLLFILISFLLITSSLLLPKTNQIGLNLTKFSCIKNQDKTSEVVEEDKHKYDKRRERVKLYQERNKEKIRQRLQRYYLKHKDEILQKQGSAVVCEVCGASCKPINFETHKLSKRHIHALLKIKARK